MHDYGKLPGHPQDEFWLEKRYDSDHMSATSDLLLVPLALPLRASNGGFFVSRGEGKHPARVINSFELIFVHSGVLRLQEDETHFTVRAGETLLLWPGRTHRGLETYPGNLSFYWLHFSLTLEGSRPIGVNELDVPQLNRVNRPDHLTSLFRRFLDDQETLRLESPSADLLVLLILFEVSGSYTSESPTQSAPENAASRLADRAHALIHTQFHTPLSTRRLAHKLYSNPDYLGRVFRRHYGSTLTEALHKRRLKHARKLLLESDRTVDTVALDCGFSDTGYFRRVFKRSEGLTPYAFRKLYSKVHINTE